MANFNTHLVVGTVVTGMGASVCYAAHLSSLPLSLSLWVLGVLGSLLPDVDSDNATVLKLLFNGLALLAMAFALFWLAFRLDLVQLWIVLASVFALVRFPLMGLFKKYSRHRGNFHSLLAVFFVGALSACFGHRVLEQSALVCWLAAAFVAGGYLIHLILDECYSVDLSNVRIKRSFGTALKPFSMQSCGRSLMMGLTAAWLFWLGPPMQKPWLSIAGSISTYVRAAL